MVHLDENTHLYERIFDLAPQAVDKINKCLRIKETIKSKKIQIVVKGTQF